MKNLSVGSGIAIAGVAVSGALVVGFVFHGTKPRQRVDLILAFATLAGEVRGG